MRISAIAACSDNGVLGKGNQLMWSLPRDWENFRVVTGSAPFFMGRKSYEAEDRLLSPGNNYILSRNQRELPETNCQIVSSLEEAMDLEKESKEFFITGGASIYRKFLDRLDFLYLTIVHHNFHGDAWFAPIDWAEWEPVSSELHLPDADHQYAFSLNEYSRKK
jgi:dihydrofolate reductase